MGILERIEKRLILLEATLLGLEEKIMASMQALQQELTEINDQTNEIASDIDDLMQKLQNPQGLSQADAAEVQAQLQALKSRLTGIASTHTP